MKKLIEIAEELNTQKLELYEARKEFIGNKKLDECLRNAEQSLANAMMFIESVIDQTTDCKHSVVECAHDESENGICIDCGAEVDWKAKVFRGDSD